MGSAFEFLKRLNAEPLSDRPRQLRPNARKATEQLFRVDVAALSVQRPELARRNE
jgi:hypothetical protein